MSRGQAQSSSQFLSAPNSHTFDLASSASSSSSDDDNPLPFPAALPRSDFLADEFDPAAYLSALPNRHQTIEDLRSDLRERSSVISSELLELVNSNYTAFLSLGSELKGGDEKVENVKVALLGFQRAVEDVKGKVAVRRQDTQALNGELRELRQEIEKGRAMLEVSERLAALEARLAIDSLPSAQSSTPWPTDDDDENGEGNVVGDGLLTGSPLKLRISTHACVEITSRMSRLDPNHAYTIKLQERLIKCRNTLLLDLGNALKEAKKAKPLDQTKLLNYLASFRALDGQREAVKMLRSA